MDLLQDFLENFDLYALLRLGIQTAAVLLCLTVHELCHGLTAYALGDQTAKRAGRLSLNPVKHIDPVGFLMLLVARVGWAKPVPVDLRHFKHPKRGMALTALAGPVSNVLLAALALMCGALLLSLFDGSGGTVLAYVIFFLCYIAVLSVGLALFNLIPVPPLDGSRILSCVLPDRLYYGLMRYERWLMLGVIALAWFGILTGPLDAAMGRLLELLCRATRFPFAFFQYYFGF